MSPAAVHPFESIEDTQQFMELLCEAIDDAAREVAEEQKSADQRGLARRADALNLAQFKLTQLRMHVTKSQRIVNDLRTIRRLMTGEREI